MFTSTNSASTKYGKCSVTRKLVNIYCKEAQFTNSLSHNNVCVCLCVCVCVCVCVCYTSSFNGQAIELLLGLKSFTNTHTLAFIIHNFIQISHLFCKNTGVHLSNNRHILILWCTFNSTHHPYSTPVI